MPKEVKKAVEPVTVSDDPIVLDTQARDAVERSAAELRKHAVAIATEPPTVYRP